MIGATQYLGLPPVFPVGFPRHSINPSRPQPGPGGPGAPPAKWSCEVRLGRWADGTGLKNVGIVSSLGYQVLPPTWLGAGWCDFLSKSRRRLVTNMWRTSGYTAKDLRYTGDISWDFWIKYNDLTISASESCVGHFLEDIGSPDWVILPSFGSSWIRQDGCYGSRLTPQFLDQPGVVLEWKILCKNGILPGAYPHGLETSVQIAMCYVYKLLFLWVTLAKSELHAVGCHWYKTHRNIC